MSQQLSFTVKFIKNSHDGYCSGNECEQTNDTDVCVLDRTDPLHTKFFQQLDRHLENNGVNSDALQKFDVLSYPKIWASLEETVKTAGGGGSHYCGNSEESVKMGLDRHECKLISYQVSVNHTDGLLETADLSFPQHIISYLYNSDNNRKTILQTALAQRGLNLRRDSKLCSRYIDGTLEPDWTVEKIVDNCAMMNWLYNHTDYPNQVKQFNDNLDQYIKTELDKIKQVIIASHGGNKPWEGL